MTRLAIIALYLVILSLPACGESSETIATISTDTDTDTDTTTDDTSSETVSSIGVPVGDFLWYLGEPTASCTDTCADHGGYDEATATFAGDNDSGGTEENCLEVLIALEVPGEQWVSSTTGAELPGVGCYFRTDYNPDAEDDTDGNPSSDIYSFKRIPLIPTTPDATIELGSRACACLK